MVEQKDVAVLAVLNVKLLAINGATLPDNSHIILYIILYIYIYIYIKNRGLG